MTKFKDWDYNDFKTWVNTIPCGGFMNPHNAIKISGEIHIDNSTPKNKTEENITEQEIFI